MRKYVKKEKLYTEASIKAAVSEVKAGKSVKGTAAKYHMSRHMLKQRVKEDAGEFTRKKQVCSFPFLRFVRVY